MRKLLILALLSLPLIPLFSCTVFYYSNGGKTLIGSNEDWKNPFSKVWFIPGDNDHHGKVYFGFKEGGVQSGMNDQGLFFDGFATSYTEVTQSEGKEVYHGNLVERAMSECSTVEEVIDLFQRYNLKFMERSMFMFGDRKGNSAIIEGDEIILKEGHYQICTNFYQSKTERDSIVCLRYLEAEKMLEGKNDVDLNLARRILANTHQEGKYPTQYSSIYDLNEGKIYLYHFHNYENTMVFDLDTELKKGKHSYDLSELFPGSFAYAAYKKPFSEEMEKRFREKEVFTVSKDVLASYCGSYEIDPNIFPGYFFDVSTEDGSLFIETSFLDRSEIFAKSESSYFLIGIEETYEFEFMEDPDDHSLRIVAKMYGMDLPARRIE